MKNITGIMKAITGLMKSGSSKMQNGKMKILVSAGVLAIAIMTGGCAGGQKQETAAEAAEEENGYEDGTGEDDGSILWNGKSYTYNDHLSNFLFLGVDTKEKAETSQGLADAGQADALFLVSMDRVTKELTVVTIPRDTMTEIRFYGPGGDDLGKDVDHINLSYAYGDGSYGSCKLSAEAVSNLLYQVPIQYYCSMGMDGIGMLTEAVGGLTVTMPNDSLAGKVPGWEKGAEILLTSENAELFVRTRDTAVSQSALDRTERQKEFLRAFYVKVKELSVEDHGTLTRLYEKMEPYLTTNMGNDLFLQLGEAVQSDADIRQWTIPGEGRQGENYDEYIVDDNALYEEVIRTFYEETE